MEKKMRQNGVPCPRCGEGLIPLFSYSGENYSLKRMNEVAYCRKCVIVFKTKMEVIWDGKGKDTNDKSTV